MDNWPTLFDGQNRYILMINDSPVKPDVLRFRGREALSEPFSWEIAFTTPQESIPPEQVLMKYATLLMRGGKNVHGIVTHLEWLSTSEDQSHYSLTLSSRLALLSETRQCRLFRFQSVPEVVEQVLREHGLEGADFEFQLERGYPDRRLITQWRESDLQFIQRILSEVGIYWRTEMDNARALDTYVFADSQLGYRFGVRLPYSEPSGLNDSAEESVWDFRTTHKVVTGKVKTRDYNYSKASTPMDAAVSVRSDAVTTGEHYRYAAPYRDAGDDTSPEPETESGAFYARIHHERELNKSARIHLYSNAAQLTPGQVLESQGNVIADLKEGMILTLVTFEGARDSRLHVSVWGMPYTERYCFRPAEIPRPEIHGTLPARIESREKNDIYAHMDDQGRYRVKLDFDRENTEPGYGYLWLRMAKPTAGKMLGWHTPLTDGTEVAIAYSNGDIDLPYIAYALHDSEHPDLVNRDNHTRNILRTPANSKLRMEDKRGEEHIKLATEYGRTQLNSGHLVDSQRQLRGKGAELRTDEWGTIRAGKGLFVSADAQAKAQGDALDRDAALKEIGLLNQHLQQLGMAAEQAQSLKADIDNQIQMFEQRLKPLNEAVLFSAPEGVALTSGEHLQMTAAKNAAVNAGGDISVGAMGNMTALAGDKLGVFTRSGQLSLKSGEGPVEVQAQNASMSLFAEKKLTLGSASDISITGKKRITLIGGGSYLRLDAGKVEYGTTATYQRKVKKTMAAGSATLEQHPVALPAAVSDEKISSDMLLRKPGETDTQWAERMVKLNVAARLIEQKTGIPRSRIAKWPIYRKIIEEQNQAKAEKTQGRQQAAQLMCNKDIVTHKDLVVISRKTGIPTGTLRRMDEYRARRPEKQKETRIQDKEKAKKLLLEKRSVRAIAKETQVAERTLHNWKHDLKNLKTNDVAASVSERENVLMKQIATIKQVVGKECNAVQSVQIKMKALLSSAIDELDPFVRDCTTTAIGVDNNNQYYLSSSSYPVCQKLKIWARSHRITVVEDAGHAEAVLVNTVSKIKHIEPSRDVCLECEHKMLKHHVTTSRPFSHKLSKGQRTGKSYTEEERQFAKTMKAESSIKANNVAKARRLLVEGDLSLTDIGRQTGVNKSTMVSWPEHKIWVEKQKKRKAGDPRKAKALAMSLEGISQNEIAKKLKTSKTKISQWIKESKQKNTDYAMPTTSGKRAALRQGLSHTTRAHMQSSLRSEIRVASEGLNQQGLLRWLQEPGMSQHSYHDILDVLEEEEIDFNINDFISAWNATGRPLPE